ncbi:hypothetical protein LPJ81_003892, partial [Coemansia sp. IMI 209127]
SAKQKTKGAVMYASSMKAAMKALLEANPSKDYGDDMAVLGTIISICSGLSEKRFKQVSDAYWQAATSTKDPGDAGDVDSVMVATSTEDPDVANDMAPAPADEQPAPHVGMRFDSYEALQSYIKRFNEYSGSRFIVVGSRYMGDVIRNGHVVLRCNQYKEYIEHGANSAISSKMKKMQTKSKVPRSGCAARIDVVKDIVGERASVRISRLQLEHTGHTVIMPEAVTVVNTNEAVLRGLACEIALAGVHTSAALKMVSLTHNSTVRDTKQIENMVYRERQRLGMVETADEDT